MRCVIWSGWREAIEMNVTLNKCSNCNEPLLYAIELDREKLWGLCKRCFHKGLIPNPPYNRFLKK